MKKYIFALIILITLVLVSLLAFVLIKNNKKEIKKNEVKSYLIEEFDDSISFEYYLFKSNEELREKFDVSKVSNQTFNDKNILAIRLSIDSCSERNIKISNYELRNNILIINIDYEVACGFCMSNDVYYLMEIEKDLEFSNIKLNYHQTNKINCPTDVAYKPIIYLYPEKETYVTLKLLNSSYLTSTYPKYNNGWSVYAYPNGSLSANSREYYGLYWEGNNYNGKITDEGFVVKGEETISFLEEKLKILGLTEREANEFIIYWLPKLEKNKYNYIRFASIQEINDYMPLEINPKPDSIIRIMMEYKPLDYKIDVKNQKLETPKREGFVLVEWGGSLIK